MIFIIYLFIKLNSCVFHLWVLNGCLQYTTLNLLQCIVKFETDFKLFESA